MPNFDGLWELRIFYTTTPTGFTPLEHRHTIDVAVQPDDGVSPGDPFSAFYVDARSGATFSLGDWTDDYVTGLKPFFHTSVDFSRAELWKIPEGTFDATFWSTYDLSTNGTSATASAPANQVTMTFRSATGGGARIQLMETSLNGDSKVSFPSSNTPANTLSSFAIDPDSPIKARDNGYLIGRINLAIGENEKLWRKRFRS